MEDKFINVHEALRWASLFLQEHNCEEKVAEILLQHHTGMSKSRLLASLREPLKKEEKRLFIEDVKKHVDTGIPVQHLTGKEMFYGREFFVNKHVLIPRPETEELVEAVLAVVKQKALNKSLRLIDLGTGSGIIAISAKLECPELTVSASDISKDALTVARRNADNLDADVTFLEGDFLQPFHESEDKFDVIVSNPPYIAEDERDTLSPTVKNFDPSLALFAPESGLAAYRKILSQARQKAAPEALLAFEIGQHQGSQLKSMTEQFFPSAIVKVKKDINGKDRILLAFLSTTDADVCG